MTRASPRRRRRSGSPFWVALTRPRKRAASHSPLPIADFGPPSKKSHAQATPGDFKSRPSTLYTGQPLPLRRPSLRAQSQQVHLVEFMAGFFSGEALTAFFQVIMIDLVLAGDNAIVIGLAA